MTCNTQEPVNKVQHIYSDTSEKWLSQLSVNCVGWGVLSSGLTQGSKTCGYMPTIMMRYLMMTVRLAGQHVTNAAHSSSISRS